MKMPLQRRHSGKDRKSPGAVRSALRFNLGDHPFWWLCPVTIVLAVFYVYPVLEVLRTSFTDATLLDTSYRYTLGSYRSILADPALSQILEATFVFVAGSVIGQITLGLLISLALQAGLKRRLFGVGAVRVTVLATWVVPGVASAITWQLLLSEADFGFFNAMLKLASLPPVPWLSDPWMAVRSATVANIWYGTALSVILLYAGLQTISPTLYEAAAVDGATAIQTFWHITLPGLRPTLLITVIIVSVLSLNTFEVVMPLTGGGPGRSTEVLALAAYNMVFYDFNLAQGSVLAVLMLLINLAVATTFWLLFRGSR